MVVVPAFSLNRKDLAEQIQRDNWLSPDSTEGKFPYLGSKERVDRFRMNDNTTISRIMNDGPFYRTHEQNAVSIFVGRIQTFEPEDYHTIARVQAMMCMGNHIQNPGLYDACLQRTNRFWYINCGAV